MNRWDPFSGYRVGGAVARMGVNNRLNIRALAHDVAVKTPLGGGTVRSMRRPVHFQINNFFGRHRIIAEAGRGN